MSWSMEAAEVTYRQPTFRRDDTAGQLNALHADGYALIPGVLSAEEVHAVRCAIDGLQPIHWDKQGPTDHYKCVFNRDPFWLRFLDLPGIIDLAEAALGGDCHIIGQTAWRNQPGVRGRGLHADYLVVEMPEEWLSDRRFVLPMQICTAHFYLSDITPALCPTRVIPGSHKAGRHPKRETEWHGQRPEDVLCRAGDALFFRSELWHSGSNNTTASEVRYLLQVHYGRRMVAQKFSPYIKWQFNSRVLEACTPRQLRLLGDHKQSAYD